MKPPALRLLLIEDNDGDAHLVEAFLEEGLSVPYKMKRANTLAKGLHLLEQGNFDVVLLDLTLPDSIGLETFSQLHPRANHVPIVVLSGADDEQSALEAVRQGAQDYLVKGSTDSSLLARALQFAIERTAWMQQYQAERQQITAKLSHLRALISELTPREREILEQIAEGKSLKQIAGALGTSYNTVKNQRSRVVEKLEAESDADLVRMVLVVRFGNPSGDGQKPARE